MLIQLQPNITFVFPDSFWDGIEASLTSNYMLSPWPLNFTGKYEEYFYQGHTILTPQQLFFILWLTLTSGVKTTNGPTTKAVLF